MACDRSCIRLSIGRVRVFFHGVLSKHGAGVWGFLVHWLYTSIVLSSFLLTFDGGYERCSTLVIPDPIKVLPFCHHANSPSYNSPLS